MTGYYHHYLDLTVRSSEWLRVAFTLIRAVAVHLGQDFFGIGKYSKSATKAVTKAEAAFNASTIASRDDSDLTMPS